MGVPTALKGKETFAYQTHGGCVPSAPAPKWPPGFRLRRASPILSTGFPSSAVKTFARLLPAALLAIAAPALSQPATPVPPPANSDLLILKPGELPEYDSLRLQGGEVMPIGERFLPTLPTLSEDLITSSIVFPEVPATERFARLSLNDVVNLALDNNFTLQNSSRNVRIARSSTTGAEANFIPFVDLVSTARMDYAEDNNVTVTETPTEAELLADPLATGTSRSNGTDETRTNTSSAGIESGVNLPTGGRITANANTDRTFTKTESRPDDPTNSENYNSRGEVRFIQPLLRGGGTDVGTAELRRSRLREMDSIIGDQIQRRDVVLNVIRAYFQLLQTARQLQVSREALRERLRFLDDTRVKYSVGRVDESEILRAEIQYLSEMETAVGRRQQLDTGREELLLLLGLPLETPISFVDITDTLALRGRVEIPAVGEAVAEALSNRLELMRQDISISLGEIDHRVARNDLLPTLDIDAGYRRLDSGERLSDASGYEDWGWDAGLAFRLPLINIQRREAAKRSALSLENTRTNRIVAERDLTQAVYAAHRGVLATETQLTILKKNVEQARKTLQLINGRFEVGFSTVTEVRLAQDDLFQSETRFSNTLLNYQLQVAQLYVALGRSLY